MGREQNLSDHHEINRLRTQLAFWRCIALCLGISLALSCLSAFGQQQAVGGFRITRLQNEHDALEAAIADANDAANPSCLRYVWLQETSEPRLAGVHFVTNAVISRSPHPIHSAVISDGHLVRLDFSKLLPDPKDFFEVAGVWERLAELDFFFHEQAQKDIAIIDVGATIVVISDNAVIQTRRDVVGLVPRRWTGKIQKVSGEWLWIECNGKSGWLHSRYVKPKDSHVPFAAHIADKMSVLSSLTESAAPIVRAETFVAKCFSTHLGLYYDFLGLQGKTLDDVFKIFHASIKSIEEADSDAWAAISRSGVTQNPRAWAAIPMSSPAPTVGTRIGLLTFDLNNKNNNPKLDPILNIYLTLFQLKFDGGEGIFQRQNGYPVGVLYDGQKKLVDVVPSSIATDSTDQTAHKELRPGISCHRCHDLWHKDSGNNVRWLAINGGPSLGNLAADINQLKLGKTAEEIWSEVAAKYMGDLQTVLDDSRRMMARQIFLGCGSPAETAIAGASELYAAYEFGEYTPARVLRWLGHAVEVDLQAGVRPAFPIIESALTASRGRELTPIQQRSAFRQICPPPQGREDAGIIGLRLWQPDNSDSMHMGARAFERVFTSLAWLRDRADNQQSRVK